MSTIKGGNISKMGNFLIILISCLFTLIIGFMFMILYWLGEVTGIAPVIQLGGLDWATTGEGIIIFIIFLLLSVFSGSFIVLYLLKKYN